jgi:hypothetical protein
MVESRGKVPLSGFYRYIPTHHHPVFHSPLTCGDRARERVGEGAGEGLCGSPWFTVVQALFTALLLRVLDVSGCSGDFISVCTQSALATQTYAKLNVIKSRPSLVALPPSLSLSLSLSLYRFLLSGIPLRQYTRRHDTRYVRPTGV